jgi:penicillin-binding protein 2
MDIFGNFSKLKGDKISRRVHREEEVDFSYGDIVSIPIAKMEDKAKTNSFTPLKMLTFVIFSILLVRLFTLQIAQGEANQIIAEGHGIRNRLIDSTRGVISDKNGAWLARSQPSFALAVYPSDMPRKKTERADLYAKLSELAGISVDEVKAIVEKNGLTSVTEALVKENISHDEALLLEEKVAGMPGVFVAKKAVREYKTMPGLGHILGYTGMVTPDDLKDTVTYYPSDKLGKTGLEYSYENFLKGTHGIEEVEVDAKGNTVKVMANDQNKEPVPGNNLVLNLDLGLQQKTAEALQQGIDIGKQATGDDLKSGVAIVMNVKTGGILSMVSLPDYNNNLFATKISTQDYQGLMTDASKPMYNRAISGAYPPGSVSKIILASAGLQEGTITKNTSIVTPAAIRIGEYTFPDWKDHSYESTNIERAIAESNNIMFYSLGGGFDKIKGIGIDKIKQYWQLFGLGKPTGIDIPGEASGLLPDAAWKKKATGESWYLGDTYHVSIGQGDMLVTPLQMLGATVAIANGGKVMKPQLVNKILDTKGNVLKEFGPEVVRQDFLRPDVISTVQSGMRMTITDGSGRSLNDLPIEVAGKTGTAQFQNNEKTHAWFECYAPYDNPEIAIIVMIEGGGEGYVAAAPVAKSIMSYYFSPDRK